MVSAQFILYIFDDIGKNNPIENIFITYLLLFYVSTIYLRFGTFTVNLN